MWKYEGVVLKILNWAKYNPKRAQKSYSWFRLNNDFPSDPKLVSLDAEQMFVLMTLMCEGSKENDGIAEVDYDFFAHKKVEPDKIDRLVDYLIRKRVVQVVQNKSDLAPPPPPPATPDPGSAQPPATPDDPPLHGTTPHYPEQPPATPPCSAVPNSTPTNGRTNETNKTNERDPTTNVVCKEDVDRCVRVWGLTLTRYGNPKDPRFDKFPIAQLIKDHGVDLAYLALLGAGYEESSRDYNAAKHVSIRRLFRPDVFDKFVNLGAKEAEIERRRQADRAAFEQTLARLSPPPPPDAEPGPPCDPGRVREILAANGCGGLLKAMPIPPPDVA